MKSILSPSEKGFSLLEVLVYIGVSSIFLSSIVGSLFFVQFESQKNQLLLTNEVEISSFLLSFENVLQDYALKDLLVSEHEVRFYDQNQHINRGFGIENGSLVDNTFNSSSSRTIVDSLQDIRFELLLATSTSHIQHLLKITLSSKVSDYERIYEIKE